MYIIEKEAEVHKKLIKILNSIVVRLNIDGREFVFPFIRQLNVYKSKHSIKNF